MKLTLKNKDITEQYNLLETAPQPPFATINGNYFLRLSNNGDSKFKLNGLFIYKEIIGKDKFLYYSDKNNILHKINILTQKEVWKYDAGNDIKSIAIDSNKHIFILTKDGMLEIDNNSTDISTNTTIKGNKMIIDGNIYLADGKEVSKLDSSYNEIASYSVDDNITNLASDSKGNIYIGTNSEITKVKNEFRASGESRNILPPFDNNSLEWQNTNTGKIDKAYINNKTIFIPNNYRYQFIFTSKGVDIKPNIQYSLSFKYVKGNKIGLAIGYFFNGSYTSCTDDMIIDKEQYIIDTPTKCDSCILYFNRIDTDYEITDVQLEEGNKATPYAPKGTYIQGYEWKYKVANVNSLTTKDDKLYIATNEDIQVLDANGNMIDGLNITDTNAIGIDGSELYLGQGNNLNKYINKQKQWTYNNNSEITNIILEE